ncbi:MAG TPA: hypothetical protein VGL55_03825 [Steroidobacteraceae bacterium]|jgi:hypothetical protein
MRLFLVALCLSAVVPVQAAKDLGRKTTAPASELAGRWEGSLRLPGEDIRIIVDLDRSGAGAWVGSITLPTLDVKGAPLSDIASEGPRTRFILPTVFGGPPDGPATIEGTVQSSGTLAGIFAQGGNRASFSLHRTGQAQVELPPASTSIDAALQGSWTGDYEMGGYARHVTLELSNHPGAVATAKFGIVGKQPHALVVELIREDEGLLRIESSEFGGIAFEGRLQQPEELRGTIEQGAADAPIVLKRVTAGAQ